MAGKAPFLEDDDDLPGGNTPSADAPPPVLRDAAQEPIRRAETKKELAEQVRIIEIDNQGREIGVDDLPVEGAPEPDAAAVAGTTDDADAGQGGKRPSKSWSARHRRKEARDQTMAQNRDLQLALRERDAKLAELEGRLNEFSGHVSDIAPRVQELSQAQAQSRLAQLDGQISDLDRRFSEADDRFYEAMQGGDKDAYRAAGRQRDELAFQRAQLHTLREQLKAAPAPTPAPAANQRPAPAPQVQDRQAAPRQLSTQAQQYASEFIEGLPWMNDPTASFDVKILRDVDNQVAAEGYDPATVDYWNELDDRLHRYLPHRFQDEPAPQSAARTQPAARRAAPQTAPLRRGPATGAPGASDRPAPKTATIDPGRRQALESAGVIDSSGKVINEQKFRRITANFAEFDRANGAGR